MIKTWIIPLFCLFCFLPLQMQGYIFESSQFSDLLISADQDTLVLCDVDNTLIESSLQLGSVQWRNHVRLKAIHAGCDRDIAEEILDKFWIFVQHFIPVNAVDARTSSVIHKLRQCKIQVFGLTARHPAEAAVTAKQLASAQIDFHPDALDECLFLRTEFPSLYQYGIIYSGDNRKSETLAAFLQETGISPKKIVFIDDRLSQIQDLEHFVEQLGIEFIGIRFSGADARVQSFDPQIADMQWSFLPQILSDEQAYQMQMGHCCSNESNWLN